MDPTKLFDEIQGGLAGIFARIEQSEDEMDAAAARHPGEADRIYHSFLLFSETQIGEWPGEQIWRAHCREILERLVAGEDTRPGTDAEIAVVCMEASMRAPLGPGAVALYARVFRSCFPEGYEQIWGDAKDHVEWTGGQHADDLERTARRRLACPDRRFDRIDVSCCGNHHGEPAPGCRFIAAAALELVELPELPPAAFHPEQGSLFPTEGDAA